MVAEQRLQAAKNAELQDEVAQLRLCALSHK